MNSTRTVADLMTTAVISLKPDHALSAVDAEMKLAAIRHIPVVDERNHLVGIVSDRDILSNLSRIQSESVSVRAIMTHDVITIRDSAPAHQATSLMLQNKISALPVIGDGNQLVGVVTETDLLRIAHEALGGEPWEI